MRDVRPVIVLIFLASLLLPGYQTDASAGLYSATVMSNNPVAYWRLDETGGSLAHDLVGAHNGTNIGGITFNAPGAIISDPDTGYGFDGTSGKTDVPFYPALNSATFSVELWARCTGGAGTFRSPLTSRTGSAPLTGYVFAASSSTWQFWIGGGGSAWKIMAGPAVVLGQWMHLVGTYDGTNQTFYVNGQRVGTVQVPFVPNASSLLRIGAGASESSGIYWFPGEIDEVAIYNYGLSAGQALADYQAGIATFGFTSAARRGTNVVLAGLGGASNGTYALLASTNLLLPRTNWTAVATNSFDGNGSFSLTNPVNPNLKQQFFALQTLPTADALWIPACGAWLGNTYYNSAMVQSAIGRQFDFFHFYNGTQTNLTATELSLIAAGQKLLINFIPATNWSWAVGTANGGKASVDAGMINLAKSVAGIKPAKIMLTILGEQERYVNGGGGNAAGAGTTNQFVAMWTNVWNIFQAEGATNVIWFWNVEGSWLDNLYGGLWPGNRYVDWVMWDPYQDSSQAYTNKLSGIYNWFLAHSTTACDWTDKPWGLAEWGIGLNGYFPTVADQTNAFNQLNDALNKNNQFPKLKLLAYFNESNATLLTNAMPAYSNLCNSPYLRQQCPH